MRQIVLTAGPYAAGSVAGLAASQAPVVGTKLTLTGTAIDTPRRLLVTAGNDAVVTRTMTLVGTNWSGNTISEVLAIGTGASATVSALDYKTLISATPTGVGWSANMSLGTSTTGTNTPLGSSAWARLDDYGFEAVALQVDVTGTANYTVESTLDDPNLVLPQVAIVPSAMTWLAHPVLAAQTSSQQGNFGIRPTFVRLTISSGTATTGSATLSVSQAGGKGG